MEVKLSKLSILKNALSATLCSFYFAFVFLFILMWSLSKEKYSFNYWLGIGSYIIIAFQTLLFFSLQFLFLIVGFYLGIKNFKKGNKKKLFLWPIIIFSVSIIFPGLFLFSIFLPLPKTMIFNLSDIIENTFTFLSSISEFLNGFLSILFSIFITSALFYKNKSLLKAVGISFLIICILLPFGKYFYEKRQKELVKEGEEILKKVELLKEKAIETGIPEWCEEIKKIDKTLDPRIENSWHALKGNLFPLGSDEYYSCIMEVAIKTGNEKLCDKMGLTGSPEKEGTKEWCQKMIFIHNTNLCKEFSEEKEKEKENCLRKIALETNDVEICIKIFDFDCVDKIALKCEKEKNEKDRDRCFELLAEKTKDIKFCEKIKNEYRKKNCVDKILKRLDKILKGIFNQRISPSPLQ